MRKILLVIALLISSTALAQDYGKPGQPGGSWGEPQPEPQILGEYDRGCTPKADIPQSLLDYFEKFNQPLPKKFCEGEVAAAPPPPPVEEEVPLPDRKPVIEEEYTEAPEPEPQYEVPPHEQCNRSCDTIEGGAERADCYLSCSPERVEPRGFDIQTPWFSGRFFFDRPWGYKARPYNYNRRWRQERKHMKRYYRDWR